MTNILRIINECEIEALKLNDVKTAIQLNWLRNAVDNGMDFNSAVYKYLQITINGGFKKDTNYFNKEV